MEGTPLQGVLAHVLSEMDGEDSNLRDIVIPLGHRAFGPVMVLCGLFLMTPLGATPGLPAASDNPDEWGDHSDVRLFARWARKRTLTNISISDALMNMHKDTLKDVSFIDPDRELRELIIRYTPSGVTSAIRSRKKSIEFLESQALYFAETYVNTDQ